MALLFVASHFLLAQTHIQGTVQDTLQQAIPFANVYATNAGGKICKFTTTNAAGKFELIILQVGDYQLHINSLNFQKRSTPIQIKDSVYRVVEKVFRLQAKIFEIKEVTVEARADIIEKQDTIVFRAEDFLNGNEEVVGELLQKLPGVNVDAHGLLSVNGKHVSRLLIEGDDLFEQNYKIVVKNLQADAIDKVEILNNFSENPLLKGMGSTDEIAMNLKLKADKKNIIFGETLLQHSFQKRYFGKLNLVGFFDKLKFYSINNLNNTGHNPAQGEVFFWLFERNSNKKPGEGLGSKIFSRVAEVYMPNFSSYRYNFNQTKFSALSFIFKPVERLSMKVIGYYFDDKNTFSEQKTTHYLLEENPFSTTEEFASRQASRSVFLKTDLIYWIGKSSKLKYMGKWNFNKLSTSTALTYNAENLSENLEESQRFADHLLVYTKKIRSTEVITLTARYIRDTRPQNYMLASSLYASLFETGSNYTHINQLAENPLAFGAAELNYYKNFRKVKIELQAGYQQTVDKLVTSINLQNSDLDEPANNNFQNHNSYRKNDYYAQFKLKNSLGKFKLRTTAGFHYLQLYANDTNYHKAYLSPEIRLSRRIGMNSFSLKYTRNTNFTETTQLYTNYLMSNYRSFARGTGYFEALKSDVLTFTYRHGRFTDDFFFNTHFSFIENKNVYGSNITLMPEYKLLEKTLLGAKQTYSIGSNIQYHFESIASRVKLSYNFNYGENANTLNGSKQTSQMYAQLFGISLQTVFSIPVNFQLGADLGYNTVKYQSFTSNSVANLTAFFNASARIVKRLTGELKTKMYQFDLKNSKKQYYFIDAELRYTVKKKRIFASVEAKNILNETEYTTQIISDYQTVEKRNFLIPRYILFGIKYKF